MKALASYGFLTIAAGRESLATAQINRAYDIRANSPQTNYDLKQPTILIQITRRVCQNKLIESGEMSAGDKTADAKDATVDFVSNGYNAKKIPCRMQVAL